MILRFERLQTELPPPSEPDPAGAAAVQELMGGKFGEMSTWLNYTFHRVKLRRSAAKLFERQRPGVARRIVSATINTMLTDPGAADNGRAPEPALAELKGVGNPHHAIAGGRAALPQNSQGRPWNGDYVFSSGDLVEDLTDNFFLETGARNNKLKVYEMVEHPAARALTGYLLVRGGVHQVAYARALERLTGSDLMKLFPSPRIPTEKIPESKPHIDRGEHLKLYRFSRTPFMRPRRSSTDPIRKRARSWRLPTSLIPKAPQRTISHHSQTCLRVTRRRSSEIAHTPEVVQGLLTGHRRSG